MAAADVALGRFLIAKELDSRCETRGVNLPTRRIYFFYIADASYLIVEQSPLALYSVKTFTRIAGAIIAESEVVDRIGRIERKCLVFST